MDFSIEHLGERGFESPLMLKTGGVYDNDHPRMLVWPVVNDPECQQTDAKFELAGPRSRLYFDPTQSRAAIVTCGGLCPGINAVIRGLVMQLWHVYKCRDIIGIRYGYQGLGEDGLEPLHLDPSMVSDIKQQGGTMLGSSRGTPSTSTMVDRLQALNVDMLFVIGGDGTMRGADLLWREIKQRGAGISVVGVPKTIDNDIPWVRRAFGFETAVQEAVNAINVAEVEARGMKNGVGLVKLMGRHAGFITATACVASGHANLCLIPEASFKLEGEEGILPWLEKRLLKHDHAVIVLAEGAGQEYVSSDEQDASGNQLLGDIGVYLKQRIRDYAVQRGIDLGVKYIEPSYLIRSAPPNASDQLYCDQLARAAVHAAMAGKGGMLIGHWNGRLTHVPIRALEGASRNVNTDGELWFSVRENTGQA